MISRERTQYHMTTYSSLVISPDQLLFDSMDGCLMIIVINVKTSIAEIDKICLNFRNKTSYKQAQQCKGNKKKRRKTQPHENLSGTFTLYVNHVYHPSLQFGKKFQSTVVFFTNTGISPAAMYIIKSLTEILPSLSEVKSYRRCLFIVDVFK